MRLPKFQYKSPATIDEAIALVSEAKGDAVIIAGGTDLLPSMKQRRLTPKIVVNIKRAEDLAYIKDGENNVRIGALTRLSSIEESDIIRKKFPMLAKAAGEVGAPQHRNAGTIGGNLCLNTRCWYYNQSAFFRTCRPVCYKFGNEEDKCQLFPTREGKANVCYSVFSGDTAPSLIALKAEVKIKGPKGERKIPLAELYTGDGKRPLALGWGDILTEVIIPDPPAYSSGCYLKYRIREAIDFPLVGVAANIVLDSKDGICERASVVLGAVASRPVEVTDAEDILRSNKITDDLIEEVSEAAFKAAKPLSNLHECSAQYRKRLAKIFTKRAINSILSAISQS
ncbi:putative 4-hydroxybenzoyl-CoA reductase, beta subunit [uncultured Desulfobacterium sp.]|uniref:Putative 4-hydroxybenzoyl-CoA reductase, beta subunit n=1 Tax=uncultured Desulfobacterium sp. TaxID=201089 RepID=A0A445MY56_9BACT|nr:putative 4-hydroxybenzoyl-CoA reductase, beta subunit [uncultured Desulfobacterium sp.]